jgi:hypothetical protein
VRTGVAGAGWTVSLGGGCVLGAVVSGVDGATGVVDGEWWLDDLGGVMTAVAVPRPLVVLEHPPATTAAATSAVQVSKVDLTADSMPVSGR